MALFSKSAAKLLQQTAKTCQYLKKNAKKVLFLKKDIDRIVMSYRCPIDVLWCSRNTRGSLPYFVGIGVGAFGIVNGVVQATGLFALQSLAGNQITHIDHIT